jgi:hypothetical protein
VRVEGQLAEGRSVVGEHPDGLVSDEEVDGGAAVGTADPDVVKAAEVTEGNPIARVDSVV